VIYRGRRPGGRAAIVDTDYGSLVIYTEDKARMARVLAAWNEHFVHAELPRTLSRQLRDAGFALRRRDVIPMFNPEYDPTPTATASSASWPPSSSAARA
jgi:hypothetical protein